MGMTLPHGGLVGEVFKNDIFKNKQLQWSATTYRIGALVNSLNADFANVGSKLGYMRRGPLVVPLVLTSDQGRLNWHHVADGVRPAGMPQYFLTRQTAEALSRGLVLDFDDGIVRVDDVRYRLHAAYLNVHVALLIRVDT